MRNNTAPVARRTDAIDTLLDALAPLLAAGDRKAARALVIAHVTAETSAAFREGEQFARAFSLSFLGR